MLSNYITYTAPHTGFEPASPYGPTVFKTAPSPPGHTAYKGDENRTHTYGIKTRCAAITLRPYHDRREIRAPGSAKTSRLPNGCIRPLCYPAIRQRVDSNHRNSFPFNSLAGSRNRPTLPRCHTKPAKRVRQGFLQKSRSISATGLEPAVYGLEDRCILPLCYADIASPERLERPLSGS